MSSSKRSWGIVYNSSDFLSESVPRRIIGLHRKILCAMLLCLMGAIGISVLGCGPSASSLPINTPSAAVAAARATNTSALPRLSRTVVAPTANSTPHRVAAPVAIIAPDLTGPRITMMLLDFYFSPNMLRVRVGQPIRLELKNPGQIEHQFAIDDSAVDVLVLPGQAEELDFVFNKAGTYPFACNVVESGNHRTAGMVGTISVEP